MIVVLVLRLIPLLCLIKASAAAAPSMVIKLGCEETCGNVSIPYPFGIGEGCFHDKWYNLSCDKSFNPPKLFFPQLELMNLEVLNISLSPRIMTVNGPVASNCKNGSFWTSSTDLRGSPFYFSTENRFLVVGCGYNALVTNQTGEILGVCGSICMNNINTTTTTNGCYGINCCQTSLLSDGLDLDIYSVNISSGTSADSTGNCGSAFLLNSDYYSATNFSTWSDVRDIDKELYAPVDLEWLFIKNPAVPVGDFPEYYCDQPGTTNNGLPSYSCYCGVVYEGNPYVPDGCKVIQECAHCKGQCYMQEGRYVCKEYHNRMPIKEIVLGVSIGGGSLFLLLGSFGLFKVIRKVLNTKRKAKFFKRNGGLLLQQQILSTKEGAIEKTKMFNSKELEKATENFNKNRILGQGGQGTVYKGMLTDGRIVAVKKSKIVDESQLEQFINEVVILSQINHRNVVKLLGCCLETEVPLLVYEFIPNGTLFELIHDQNEEFPFSWDMRLQIAIEVAGAIAYLHSAASIPIYHRDIKSTNILLDDKYRAKVADFGTSRSISIEKTHLTTLVQGTFGYLDPEYFQSSQFTEKSDVYSFGVVLVELLTGQKPISSTRLEDKSLAIHFILSLKEDRLLDILDGRVIMEGRKEEIMMIANIAKRCLNLSGKKRPTMKEVVMELEESRRCQMPSSTVQKNFQEGDCIIELSGPFDGASTSRSSHLDYTGDLSLDVHPLLCNTV